MMLLDLLRNIYSASDGISPPTWFAAFYALKWNEALATAHATADATRGSPGWEKNYAYELQSTFATEMGWTYAEVQTFLKDGRFELTPEGGMEFEEAYDAYNTIAEHWKNRGGS